MTKNTNSETEKFSKTDSDHLQAIEKLISRRLSSGELTSEDSYFIRKFVKDIRANSLISPSRQNKLVQNLVYVRQFTPIFSKCTIDDVKSAKLDLYDAVDENGNKRYTVNTQNDWLKTLKRFLIWMSKKGYCSIDVMELRDFKPTSPQKITKSPEDMLSEDEVLKILSACRNSRDRCIISMLYEGALRIGELGHLVWGDLKFSENVISMETNFKTGIRRHIPFITSRQYILQWKNDYPLQITKDLPVFISFQSKEILNYRTIFKHIRELANAAEVAKHVNPHIFRHSRITHLIQKGTPESIHSSNIKMSIDQIACDVLTPEQFNDFNWRRYNGGGNHG